MFIFMLILSVVTTIGIGFTSGDDSNNNEMLSIGTGTSTGTSTGNLPQAAAKIKKKRNRPGNPAPNSEVVALSAESIMITNGFVCYICQKGFPRKQNLQLHMRSHDIPFNLKRGNYSQVRKKVYVCPEPTCPHHHPSRALSDITGIKKHFSRKHGEKNLECERCSKTYAVLSDLKAHSKKCGTKEYRCDCGAIFSRRDSYKSHTEFCKSLPELPTNTDTHTSPLPQAAQAHQAFQLDNDLFSFPLPTHHNQLFSQNYNDVPAFSFPNSNYLQINGENFHLPIPLKPQPTYYPPPPSLPHQTATALLQKATLTGSNHVEHAATSMDGSLATWHSGKKGFLNWNCEDPTSFASANASHSLCDANMDVRQTPAFAGEEQAKRNINAINGIRGSFEFASFDCME